MIAWARQIQNSTTGLVCSVHQRSLPNWLPPGMGALDHPPTIRLERRWSPAGGDMAGHAPRGQHLSTRLVVVAGIQVQRGSLGQRDGSDDGVQGRRDQSVVTVVGRGASARQPP
jgi:hypothetical protein